MEAPDWCDPNSVRDRICRLCYQLTDLTIAIYDPEGVEYGLPDKVNYLPVIISPADELPLQLCYKCADTLINWDALLTTCLDSDRKLRSLFGVMVDAAREQTVARAADSDDEPLIPPKKRKLSELKGRAGKSRRKKCTPKKLKKTVAPRTEEEEEPREMENAPEPTLLLEFKTELLEESGGGEDFQVGAVESEEGGDAVEEAKCEVCHKEYKRKTCLERHMRQVHEEVQAREGLVCDICGNVYKTRTNLDKHYAKEHLNNQVECQVCHFSVNAKKLEIHLKTVHGVKSESSMQDKFKCRLCDNWFRNKYARNSHVKECHMSQTVKCKLCDFKGLRPVVRRHRRDVHAEKRFPCSLCDNAFKTLHTLKMHMTAHSDLRCYTCDICGMGFKRLNNVRDHMKCHEEKSNQCQICGNFFARKRYLAIHEKTIHNFYADGVVPEEKGFECGTCGAKLKWKKNLLAHMRIHTGEKPYVCKICKKDFICHGSLRTHMAKHGVCAISEKSVEGLLSPVSVVDDPLNDPQAHLQIEMNVFGHFSH